MLSMKLLKRVIWIILLVIFLWWLWARSNAEDKLEIVDGQELSTRQVLQLDLINRLNAVVWSETIAEAIVVGCMNHTEDYIKCMKQTLGVANAESGLFKKVSSKNNAFWFMERVCGTQARNPYWCTTKLKAYSSVEESVIDFIKKYDKNKWYKRDSGQAWLNWRYCTSQCDNRIPAYNDWMAEFDLSLI
jgi:hypothetical protein